MENEKKKTLIAFNGSPHVHGNTYKALKSEIEFLKNSEGYEDSTIFQIPIDLVGCRGCEKCQEGCRFEDDWFDMAIDSIRQADGVLLGSPVHLDMPTPQTVAFLTRLNCMAEPTDREFFKNKKIYLTATAYCSGTKSVIHTMMGAAEMLGFTIGGRSTREYISLWKDLKVRGGLSRKDAFFLED